MTSSPFPNISAKTLPFSQQFYNAKCPPPNNSLTFLPWPITFSLFSLVSCVLMIRCFCYIMYQFEVYGKMFLLRFEEQVILNLENDC